MNNIPGKHEPSNEFRARLERELEHGLQRTRLFGPTAAPQNTWRVARAFSLAAGAVLTLTTGIVLGASISYASAAEPELPRPPLAIRPIGNAINALRCTPAPVAAPAAKVAQQAVPVVDLPAPTARTTETLGGIIGLKEAPDGRVLVNDAGKHQLRLFEHSLATSTVMLDSVPGSATSYGQMAGPLMPFAGDSSLMFDTRLEFGLLVLNGHGQIARAVAPISMSDRGQWNRNPIGIDAKGNIIYRYEDTASFRVHYPPGPLSPPAPAGGGGGGGGGGRGRGDDGGRGERGTTLILSFVRDTVAIRRANFATRGYDTVGYVVQPPVSRIAPVKGKEETPDAAVELINPLPTVDAWAVLSDGTIAFVRGHDYHVDWVHPDGTKSSSPKLPYEWKRLTDDDKQHLVDSVRAAKDSFPRYRGPSWDGATPPVYREWPYEIVPLSQIADYWPPFSAKSKSGLTVARGAGFGGERGALQPGGLAAGGGVGRGRGVAGRGASLPGQVSEDARARLDGLRGAAIADRDGNLWILPRSALSKNGELVYDVVKPKQGLVRRVRLPLGRSIAGFGKGGVVYLQAGDVTNGFTIERTTVPGATNKASAPK